MTGSTYSCTLFEADQKSSPASCRAQTGMEYLPYGEAGQREEEKLRGGKVYGRGEEDKGCPQSETSSLRSKRGSHVETTETKTEGFYVWHVKQMGPFELGGEAISSCLPKRNNEFQCGYLSQR
jgi:hypothetical protein